MRSTEAISDNEYTIAGYERKPELILSETEVTVRLNPGTEEGRLFWIGQQWQEELNVEFSPADETATFVSPLFIKEYTIYRAKQLIAMPLDCRLARRETLLRKHHLISNDRQANNWSKIKVEYTEDV